MALRDLVTKGLIFVSSFGAVKAQEMPVASGTNVEQVELNDTLQTIPDWKELVDSGKIHFSYQVPESEIANDPTLKEMVYLLGINPARAVERNDPYFKEVIEGIGLAINTLAQDSKLGSQFFAALNNPHVDGLPIYLAQDCGDVAEHIGRVRLKLNPETVGFLDSETRRMVPLSKTHIAIHELIHFTHMYGTGNDTEAVFDYAKTEGFNAFEELSTVEETDRIMSQNFGEPRRQSYNLVYELGDGVTPIPYYKAGEKFSDHCDINACPDGELYAGEAISNLTSIFGQDEWDATTKQLFFDYDGVKQEKYLKECSPLITQKYFKDYVNRLPEAVKQYDHLKQAVDNATDDLTIAPQEWYKLKALDETLGEVRLEVRDVGTELCKLVISADETFQVGSYRSANVMFKEGAKKIDPPSR